MTAHQTMISTIDEGALMELRNTYKWGKIPKVYQLTELGLQVVEYTDYTYSKVRNKLSGEVITTRKFKSDIYPAMLKASRKPKAYWTNTSGKFSYVTRHGSVMNNTYRRQVYAGKYYITKNDNVVKLTVKINNVEVANCTSENIELFEFLKGFFNKFK